VPSPALPIHTCAFHPSTPSPAPHRRASRVLDDAWDRLEEETVAIIEALDADFCEPAEFIPREHCNSDSN
jgi:hypothetical protein